MIWSASRVVDVRSLYVPFPCGSNTASAHFRSALYAALTTQSSSSSSFKIVQSPPFEIAAFNISCLLSTVSPRGAEETANMQATATQTATAKTAGSHFFRNAMTGISLPICRPFVQPLRAKAPEEAPCL